LAEILKPISDMLKKDAKIKWDSKSCLAFQWVKDALVSAPVLASPKYDRDFIVFSFASQYTIAAVLLQKNDEGYEQPISFFSRALRDAEVRYDILEKQAYALVKALKSFRVYLLHVKIIAYVPSSAVREILV
jgi:hypothetical protein